MAGIFDRFRFDVKRARDDEAPDNCSDVQSNTEDTECMKTIAKVSAKRSKSEPRREKDSLAIGKWQERWHAICDDCFEHAQPCEHFPENRLRLLIVGHNPSDHAWKTGFSYSNPTNRMWMLLTGTLSPQSWKGILPFDAKIAEQNILPHTYGIGFTSIGLEPGNDASKYGKATMEAWRDSFFQRLRRHTARVCLCGHNNAIETVAQHEDDGAQTKCQLAHAPMLIAFSGKRQSKFPPGWPHELRADSEIWVLPSSSGRAAMTTVQRTLPYQQLADRVHRIPWPHEHQCVVTEG